MAGADKKELESRMDAMNGLPEKEISAQGSRRAHSPDPHVRDNTALYRNSADRAFAQELAEHPTTKHAGGRRIAKPTR